MLAEAAVTGATLALTHVTYLNTYREAPPEEWPHRRLIVVCCRHGRYVTLWLVWQVCSLLPLRHEIRREDED